MTVGCSAEDSKLRETQNPREKGRVTTSSSIPTFGGEKAFAFLERIVSFGPRNPNSTGHDQCLNYLVRILQGSAENVRVQTFTHRGYDRKELKLSNIIASFDPGNRSRILLCAHWDTRPRAERDSDYTRWEEPMIGANDGGSGVAVLLEMARLFHSSPPPVGVDLVLFDGEDYGLEGDIPNYLLGSRYFAQTKPPVYRFGILLDMVGDANLEILKEENSMKFAPDIVREIWTRASELGFTQFLDQNGEAITDDHLPLNEAGIKTVDLIDFAYPDESHRYWHTHEDTLDKCSAESLGAVGTVLTHVLYQQVR